MRRALSILLAALFLCWSAQAHAAITLVAACNTTNGSGSSPSITRTGATAGNGLLVMWGVADGKSLSSPTMSGETPVLHSTTFTGGVNSDVQFGYVANLQSSGNKTFGATLSGGGGSWTAAICEISGQDPINFVDVYGTNTGTGTSCTVSITTTVANAAAFGNWSHNGNAGDTAGGGYTLVDMSDVGRNAGEHNMDVGAAGSKSVSATCNSASNWGMIAIAVKPAATSSCGRLALLGVGC